MRFKTTILLVVLNLITFFFLLRQESPFDINPVTDASELGILPRPLAEVVSIEVSGDDLEQPYKILREGDDWKITEPFEWIANPFAIRRMMARMEATKANIRFAINDIASRDQSIGDFGLEQPSLQVKLTYEDETFVFNFGAPVEIGNKMYMLSPDEEEIWVIDSDVIRPFFIEIAELRSENLFAIPVFEVQSLLVEFADDSSRSRFTRIESEWVIDAPFFANGNLERIESAVDGLIRQQVTILNVGEEAAIDLPNHFNSFARIELVGNRRSSTLLVGEYLVNGVSNPNFRLGRFEGSNTVFLIAASDIEWWRTAHMELRERKFMAFDVEEATALEIVQHGENTHRLRLFKLENNQWKGYAGETSLVALDYEVDIETTLKSLADLSKLVALEFYNDEPSAEDLSLSGLDDPAMTIRVEGSSEKVLLIGNRFESDKLYVKLADSDSIYLIASDVIDRLGKDPLDYRNRRISIAGEDLYFEYFEITELQTGKVIANLEPGMLQDTAYQSLLPEDAEATAVAVIAQLNAFSAESFLAGEATTEGYQENGIFIPWAFSIKLSSTKTMENAMEVFLTKRLGGTKQYMHLPAQSVTVNIEQNLIDSLFPLLHPLELPEEYRPPENSPEVEQDQVPQTEETNAPGEQNP